MIRSDVKLMLHKVVYSTGWSVGGGGGSEGKEIREEMRGRAYALVMAEKLLEWQYREQGLL